MFYYIPPDCLAHSLPETMRWIWRLGPPITHEERNCQAKLLQNMTKKTIIVPLYNIYAPYKCHIVCISVNVNVFRIFSSHGDSNNNETAEIPTRKSDLAGRWAQRRIPGIFCYSELIEVKALMICFVWFDAQITSGIILS